MNARGRRTQRRAAERRELKAARQERAQLHIPDHIKALTRKDTREISRPRP